MKKIMIFLSVIMIIWGITVVVFAADEITSDAILFTTSVTTNEIKVQQNGVYIDFRDNEGNIVNPQIVNSRTMVPFRKIFNSLGVTDENILWDGETKTVVAKQNNIEIELQIDNTVAKKVISGDVSEIKLDSAPIIVEGRTLVPVRFIAESMNKKVGWDAQNRTVIIIDTEKLVNDLENSISQYIEIANMDSKTSGNNSLKMNLKGKIEYQSTDNKANNSTVNLTGTMILNQTADIVALNVDTKITGKGELYNSLKENKLTNFTYNLILNDNKIYLKSTSLDAKTNGKWTVREEDAIQDLFKTIGEEKISFKHIFEVDEEALNINTYKALETISSLLKVLLNDKNIEITEKGTSKTYAITMNLADIKKVLKEADIQTKWDGLDATLKISSTYKKEVLQSSACEIEFNYVEGNELLRGTLNAEGKLSTSTNVSIPDVSQVIDASEVK